MTAVIDQYETDGCTLYLGDSCEVIKGIPENSVHLNLYSPPFAGLYIYSDSEADMGNSANDEEFFEHYRYLIREKLRVTIPGRLSVVHCKDLPRFIGRDGAAGLRDFPGDIRIAHEAEAYEGARWVFHSRVTIWKDPVIEMQRTKNHGLLYKQLRKDSTYSRQGMADYLMVFRKWVDGIEDFPEPVPHTHEEFPLDTWQKWASPVWMDIQQPNVLNAAVARDSLDEKHICPLQLGLIERCIYLWSNPGDVVASWFAGIGSELYQALRCGRRALGCELKKSYFDTACRNLERARMEESQLSLADLFASTEVEV